MMMSGCAKRARKEKGYYSQGKILPCGLPIVSSVVIATLQLDFTQDSKLLY